MVGSPLREDQAVHIETLIELEAEDNGTATMSAVGGPFTGIALSLLLDAPPRMVTTPLRPIPMPSSMDHHAT